MLDALPKAKAKANLGDRVYDPAWFRTGLIARDIEPCIPPIAKRKARIDHAALTPATQDQEHVQPAQGLAAHSHPPRR